MNASLFCHASGSGRPSAAAMSPATHSIRLHGYVAGAGKADKEVDLSKDEVVLKVAT